MVNLTQPELLDGHITPDDLAIFQRHLHTWGWQTRKQIAAVVVRRALTTALEEARS